MKNDLKILVLMLIFLLCAWLIVTSAHAEEETEMDSNDLYILSHIINAEAGDDNCSHDHRIAVGSVAKHTISLFEMIENDCKDNDLWLEKLTDQINYLLLLKGLIRDQEAPESPQTRLLH